MKKRLIKEKGSASLFVLITVLFFIVFLISMYGYITNSEVTQLEQISKIKDIYEKDVNNVDDIYDKLVAETEMIPIYTLEQLKKIGSGENLDIDDKTYNFSNTATYKFMDNIEVNLADLPLENTENFIGVIEGRNKTLYVNSDINITEDDINLFKNEKAICRNLNIEIITALKYTFTINPTPVDATVTINGITTNTVSVKKGEEVNWKVEYMGYITKEGTYTVENDATINVSLEVLQYTFTIKADPSDSIITINGNKTNSIIVDYGTNITYKVEHDGYYSQQNSINIYEDTVINVNLESWRYINFSEKFYFTRTDDSNYEALCNGGSVTLSRYNLGGADYNMGRLYLDESDIVKKIPVTANISKVSVYFQYYQQKNNTLLYTNRIKTTIYVGNIEKMAQQETGNSDQTERQAKYELTNITRNELKNSLSVRLVNYIEGTLTIDSTVENLYCIIEGSYPDI